MARRIVHGLERTKVFTVRLSESEDLRLQKRFEASRARSKSAFGRAALLTGYVEDGEAIRGLRNEIIKLTALLCRKDDRRARDAAVEALERISRF